MSDYDFNGLFIYDLANNHQGDLAHGLNIIKALGAVNRETGARGALKFQFRQIDTFIHPDYKARDDLPHIGRFVSTRVSTDAYEKMVLQVKEEGMISICTPFDEESVDLICDLDIEIIKIASCSAADRPLLEKVARAGKPVIASTAGLNYEQLDMMVSLFESYGVDYALMYCVAIYPTPNDQLNLNRITRLKHRYPDVTIGFSTHENPDNLQAVQLAYALGARLFERHVGLNTDKYQLNAYSSTPEQIQAWIQSSQDSLIICGNPVREVNVKENQSLNTLKRGIFVKQTLKKGERIRREDVFFAMPLLEGQLSSESWHQDMIAEQNYEIYAAVMEKTTMRPFNQREFICHIILQVKGMINRAGIKFGKESSIELSHHYGLEQLRHYGAIIVNIINRDYCKKLVIQLPGQKHPNHYHELKEETFQLLYGDLEVIVDQRKKQLQPGGLQLVKADQWHQFSSKNGAIFEEVSTTHYNNDSLYEDKAISEKPREERKTEIPNWEAAILCAGELD